MKKLLALLVFVFLIPNVRAQENVVCLVYFSGYACGDDCGLTDTFMEGLLNEYSYNLTAIKYHVDASQENTDLFEAYQASYGLPSSVPLVLFGKNDYLFGKDEIYRNTESRILNFLGQNGTNCPLESGYVPPRNLKPDDLPGQPEVFQNEEPEEEPEEENRTGETQTVIPDIAGPVKSVINDVLKYENFNALLIITAILIALVFGASLMFLRKKVRQVG